jgi:hypothetical protein
MVKQAGVGTEPKKPKRSDAQMRAGVEVAQAKMKQADLRGEQKGAAFLANKQGRSPLTDAMMKRMMALSPGGVG